MSTITIESQGRRHYVVGNTYPIKDRLRAAGCKWDPERKAWWSGKRETAEQAIAGASPEHRTGAAESSPDAPGESAIVAGRASYKGRTYLVAGRIDRGRTQWDDRVEPVMSRDGSRVLLLFRDGSRQFWAPLARLRDDALTIRVGEPLPLTEGAEITKQYERPKTVGSLQRFAQEARRNGGTHPDACPNCGSLSCSTAYGRPGLCDED